MNGFRMRIDESQRMKTLPEASLVFEADVIPSFIASFYSHR